VLGSIDRPEVLNAGAPRGSLFAIVVLASLMRKTTKSQIQANPALAREFPDRLTELEKELRLHLARKATDRPLKAIHELSQATIEGTPVLQFDLGKHSYAAGHDDVTYSGSNHARGVRHIRFYAEGKNVLDIEGDFEDQQFGSNFRFQNMDLYVPGTWETDFLKLTDDLRQHAEKRKYAFKKKRDAEQSRLRRTR
jgi:hypothetical protein